MTRRRNVLLLGGGRAEPIDEIRRDCFHWLTFYTERRSVAATTRSLALDDMQLAASALTGGQALINGHVLCRDRIPGELHGIFGGAQLPGY